MCGRYQLTAPPEAVRALFAVETDFEPFPARHNIAPTQPIPVVHVDGAGRRALALMRWGLLPSWVKDPKAFSLLINARIETAADKPAFRAAMKRRRCLVPATGFYEWRKADGGPKRPFLLEGAEAPLFAFAGLWETWTGPDGEEVDTAAILTRDATGDIAHIHHRMPVVVPPEAFGAWLDAAHHDAADALGALGPAEEGFFRVTEITRRINDARNEGPDVAAPAEGAADEPPPARRAGGAGEGGTRPAGTGGRRKTAADGGQLDLLGRAQEETAPPVGARNRE